MKRRNSLWVLVCSLAAMLLVGRPSTELAAPSTTIVISQVYGGGGNSGATLKNDFIELYNRGTTTVSLTGWSVQYASSSGTSWSVTNLSGSLAPGQYYLVQEAQGSGGTVNLPTPNATGTIAMAAAAGKVALANSTTALSGSCPTGSPIVDFVGYGNGTGSNLANCSETLPAPTLSNVTADLRANAGATDTDNNSADFSTGTPNPRNSEPPTDAAPSVTSTTPAGGATNVAVNSNIVVNFSESVTASASAFTLQCPAGTPKTFTQSASPSNAVTLTPSSALPLNTTCTVTVTAAQITDTDTTDPPDNMTSDYTFSFGTTAGADSAPAVATTIPANSASGIPINSNIVVNFSESVTAQAGAFTIQCLGGPALTLSASSSPSMGFTLTPSAGLPYGSSCTVTVMANLISDEDTSDPPDNMAANHTFSFTTEAQPAATGIIINEIDADTPGSDTAEFIELYDGGIGNTNLDGLVVVLYEGLSDPSTAANHKSYAAFDLDGYRTNANGYFVLGNPGVPGTEPGVGIEFLPGPFGLLQNGPDAVALYQASASNFPNGTPLPPTAPANLRDAIVYGTGDANDAQLLVLLNAGQPQVNENAGGSGTTQSSARCGNGAGGLRNTSSYVQVAPTSGSANVCPPPRPPSQIVISQLYGGGGNSGATYRNDYVELYNRGAATVFIDGWSLQYASSTGFGWDSNKQPLGGMIGPGEYLLISLASGGANGASLPPANITGQINMSATTGKIALADSYDGLAGNCPIFNPHVMDFVGYGTGADCREGNLPSHNALAPSNTTALFRLNFGLTDTDINHDDFVTGGPNPRRTAPIVELGPAVFTTDPPSNATNTPRDGTIQVIFTEPVDVAGPWFDITCLQSGQHNYATTAVSFGGQSHYITPNVNFVAGEMCTVKLLKDYIHDVDTDDSGSNTDMLVTDYSWTFTVSTGTAPPYPPSVHLTMGNPSGAVEDFSSPNNYLMEKPEFALSYSRDFGWPNWVSWHLSDEWIGTLARVDTFRPDPQVPPDWYRVQSFDFSGSGFDRGHMAPNADRDKETSSPINQATFLMSNMVAQAPGNNQGPWAALEGFLRTLVDAGDEIYIVSGPAGTGGTGSNLPPTVTTTLADGHVTVPASTWKVALVLPKGDNDISRVTCSSRTIAVIMPNLDSIRPDDWHNYLTTVDAVEALTGYNLFSNVPTQYQACVEARRDGDPVLPLDTTAPTISCPAADGLWHPANVTPACTASDSGSGLANPSDSSFSLFTSVAAGAEDANASTNSRMVCDVAGNCNTATIGGNKIDRKGPDISVTTPPNGASYPLNAIVNASYVCPDAGSGPSGCTGTVANLSAIDTSAAGAKTFVVNATDAVGNTSSATVTYDVLRQNTALSGLSNASGTYGGTTALSATLTSDSVPLAGRTISFMLNGSAVGTAVTNGSGVATLSNASLAGINATTYPGGVQASFAGDSNYGPSAASADLSVTSRPLTITADANTRIYGTPDPALTYQITSGSLVGGDSLAGSLTRASGDAVGAYAIQQGSVSGGVNYALSYVGANLTITQASTATSVASSLNPSPMGSAVTFTANVIPVAPAVGTPTGSMTFTDGVLVLATVPLNGSGQAFLTVSLVLGSHVIAARYNSDSNFQSSNSPGLIQTVYAPIASAGSDITVGPRQSFTLSGSWTDLPQVMGNPYSWSWTVVDAAVKSNGQALEGASGTAGYATSIPFTGDIAVPGTYRFRFSVTDKDGAAGLDEVVVTVRNSQWVAFGINSVEFKHDAKVVSGDVGGPFQATGKTLTEKGVEVGIGVNVQIGPQSAVYADTLRVGSQSSVYLAFFRELLDRGPGNITNEVPSLPAGVVAPSLAAPSGDSGTEDIWYNGGNNDCQQADTTCKNSGDTLAPGSYADLRSRAGSKNNPVVIRLAGGTYFFESVNLGSWAAIRVDGPTTIHVAQQFDTDKGSSIGPSVGSGLSAKDIVLCVGGINGRGGNIGSHPKSAEIGSDNVIAVNIYTPNGTLWLHEGTIATGGFVARDVEVGVNVTLSLDSAFQ